MPQRRLKSLLFHELPPEAKDRELFKYLHPAVVTPTNTDPLRRAWCAKRKNMRVDKKPLYLHVTLEALAQLLQLDALNRWEIGKDFLLLPSITASQQGVVDLLNEKKKQSSSYDKYWLGTSS